MLPHQTTDTAMPQYTLRRVGRIWAAAALPMAILGWIIAPAFTPDIQSNPIGAVAIRYSVLTLGLIRLFILSLISVYREEHVHPGQRWLR